MTFYPHERKEKTERYFGPRPGYPFVETNSVSLQIMFDYLDSRGLCFSTARKNDWYLSHEANDSWARIVIPCSNSAGVPYWQARAISPEAKVRYQSPKATREDSVAFVWPQERCRGTVIVEGPLDALKAAGLGFLGVGLMGAEPPEKVFDYLVNIIRSFVPVFIVPDLDHLEMGAYVLGSLANRQISATIVVPPRKDLAECSDKEVLGLFK